MWHRLVFFCGIVFLFCLKLVLGKLDNVYNFSCFLQTNGDGTGELVQEVNMKADYTTSTHNKFIVKLDLDDIIDEKIKAYMDAKIILSKAKIKPKTKMNKKTPHYNLRFHKTKQRRSVPDNTDDLSLKSLDPEKVIVEQSEIKRKWKELEIKYEELRYLVYEMQNNISILESDKQNLEKEISKFEEKILKKEAASTQLDKRIEEIFEIFCSYIFITEKSVEMDIPLSFRENLWLTCSKKFGFQKQFMPITYPELEALKASCSQQDSCAVIRNSDSLIEYNCQCGPLCSTFDTCCFDSIYRNIPPSDGPYQSCRVVYAVFPLAAFMVEECPRTERTENALKTLCAQGKEDDFMTLVPVTSARTNLTYKNYYCFACHEITDDYHFWEIEVRSEKKIATHNFSNNPIIVYDSISKDWVGEYIDGEKNASLLIWIKKPSKIKHLIKECRGGVIDKCHDNWQDDITRNKCNDYTAIINLYDPFVHSDPKIYKNPHCAVCNFEYFSNDTYCGFMGQPFSLPHRIFPISFDVSSIGLEYELKIRFSYSNFFTVTTSNCSGNFKWNPILNKCSHLRCSKGFSLIDGNCIRS